MNWEVQLLQFLQEMRNPLLTALMEAISFMAESLFAVAIIATLYWCVDKSRMIRFAWMILVSGVTNGVLKNIVKAPRPFQTGVTTPLRLETATSYSFPSGHTQNATSFWLGAAKVLENKSILGMGSIFIILTAISRMYLGVHWPVDVIGGIIVGVLSLILADSLYDSNKGFNNWHVIGVGGIAFIFIVIPIESNLSSAVGALWGLVIGGYIEQKYIKFKVEGDWKIQVKKLLIGYIGTLLLYVSFNKLFGSDELLEMIKHALILVWIVAGAPYIFEKTLYNKRKK